MSGRSRWQVVDYGFRHLHTRIDEPLQLEELAATLGYSQFHLSRLVQKETGLSLKSYLNRMRILKARRLLAETDEPVTQIALAVGYSSLGTFSRCFRSLVGLAPTDFRAYLAGNGSGAQQAASVEESSLSGSVVRRGDFFGHIHIGLFPTREPAGFPVAQTVLSKPGAFTMRSLPAGRHYVVAVACCCHPAYPGDVSGAWAWGVADRPVEFGPDRLEATNVVIDLVGRTPTSPPILATFSCDHMSKYGEAERDGPPVTCGLRPLTPRGEVGGEVGRGGFPTMIRGIASVLVYVGDIDKAADFYGRLLSTAPAHRDPTTVTFEMGQTRLILHRDKLPSRAGVRGAMEFNLEVDDARAFYETIRERGIEAAPPRRMPWGWVLLTVRDPAGNEIEVYEVGK